ncbi:MAG TPA: preprotein translocase subunit SecG [Candidatus Binataceae bacterium]|nr:preprotein translocase subunit SecG [Candidatus Binataceae bacterium]
MTSLVVGIHVIVCISLVIVILLQQGKGAEVGAVFGGSSQTVFGASGAGNILTKITTGLAVAFFATSMYLAYASTQRATGSIFGGRASSSIMSKTAPAPKGKESGTPVANAVNTPIANTAPLHNAAPAAPAPKGAPAAPAKK